MKKRAIQYGKLHVYPSNWMTAHIVGQLETTGGFCKVRHRACSIRCSTVNMGYTNVGSAQGTFIIFYNTLKVLKQL